MLEEVEMAVALGLGIVNRMQALRAFIWKTAALLEIDGNRQEFLARVELDILDIPRCFDAKRRREKLVANVVLPCVAAPATTRMPPCSQPSRTSPAGGRSRSGHP
jgi:hypothetical protein